MTPDPTNAIQGSLPGATTDPKPEIRVFPPTGTPRRTALIIFPGGGYQGLAEHEGSGYAEAFAADGFACFVVTYRLASGRHRHPAMIEDAFAAIHTVRARADEFGIERLGVIGSSAGGHLAAHAMTAWPGHPLGQALRPDFGILVYPVITGEARFTSTLTLENWSGGTVDEAKRAEFSLENHVGPDTPPCFLWHTVEDTTVPFENSVRYARALGDHGIPFELHVYQKGRHGLGLGTGFDWKREFLRWLDDGV